MDVDDVGARLGEGGDQPVGILHHQVYVEGHAGQRTDPLNDGRPETEVGYENAVHDIEMDHVGAGAFHKSDFVSQMGEITGEY